MLLEGAVFRFNAAGFGYGNFSVANDTGVVNRGYIRCVEMECLQICTACEFVYEAASVRPTAYATLPPITTADRTARRNMLISVVSVCSVLLFGYGVAVVKWKRGHCFNHAEDTDAQIEGLSHQQPTTSLLCAVEGSLVRMPEHRGSIELALTSDVRSRSDATIAEREATIAERDATIAARDATIARQRERAMPFLEASPSPALVVCRNMRIAVWSPGEWCH